MNRGVLLYAHNNNEIDYFKIACANALMIKKNLNVPVTLVTDEGSLNYGKSILGNDLVNLCFKSIILVKRNYDFNNPRNYSDTSFNVKNLQFYNTAHWEAYELSPYDETLFIDVDYLIMSNSLSNCWGSDNDVMITQRIMSPMGETEQRYIDDFGIKLYWATVVYFKKSLLAKFLFDLVKHIEQNYVYYNELYCISGNMYRNDNAFSIAIHILNGFSDITPIVGDLPIPALMMIWDSNDIMKIDKINDMYIYAEKKNAKGEYNLVRFKNTDLHIMNKWAINRHADKLLDLYK